MEIINTRILKKLLDKNKRLFEGLLPELIKRLILANKDGIKHIRIPSKDDVWAPGFDGIVENDIARLFLAKGTSVWEFGTCEHSLEKINSDYQKRTSDTLGINKQEATFYFVLPKIWAFNKKMSISEWESSKADWKAVKIIDGSILCTWLSQEIDVAIWLLENCLTTKGLDIASVKRAWEKLSERTNPLLNHELFLNGREEFKQRLIDAINSQMVTRVKSDTLIDALGFTLSALLENAELKETVIVVENLNSYKEISKIVNSKILLLSFNYEGEVVKSNKTILLYNKEITTISVDLDIPQMRKNNFIQALKNMGIDDGKVYKIIAGTHRNLLAIIRRIASEAFRDSPKWADKDDKIFLMPLLLMNRINTNSAAHKNIVELLSEKTYSEFEQKMKVLLLLEDSPIKQVDNFCCIMCYEEAWNILQLKTNESGFNNMVKIINTVAYYYAEKHKEIDSRFLNITNAETLQEIPLKSFFESIVYYSYIDEFSKNNVDKLIYDILKECNHPKVFHLFSDHFLLFAEAAPSVMANFFEEQIKIENSLLLQMMSGVDYGSDYCRILWALNVLTFFDETKISACNILAKLMFRQIKYKISNSPEDSLLNTLCLWNTDNALTLDEKKKIILKFLKSNPIEFAPFVVKLLGTNIVVPSGGLKVELRKAHRVFFNEYFETINEIVNEVIDIALQNKDLSLIQNIVDEYKVLYPKTLTRISEEINRENFDEQPLWKFNFHVMRKISDIRKYGNCEAWAGSKEYLPALNALCEKTKSEDIILQNACYFKDFYHCPIIDDDEFNGSNDFKKEDRYRKEFRKNIFYTLKKEFGKEFNNKIVDIMNDEWGWGVFLNEVIEPKEFNSLCDELIRINKNLILSGLLNSANVDLVKNKIDKISGNLQIKIISLLTRLDLIEILDTEEKRIAFWQNKELWEFNQEIFNAICKYNPIGLLRYYYRTKVNPLNCETVIGILEKILEHKQVNKDNYFDHIITELFDQCDSIFYSEKLALIEYEYYKEKVIRSFPNGLCRYWFENPQELVKILISAKQENYDTYFDIAYNYRLPLVAYKDENKFNFFFESILKTATITKDKESMLSILGKVMGRSEKGNDGIFPHEFVRKKLQKLDNETLNNGFIVGKLNTRGARFIADGEDERIIAIHYRNVARQIAIDYPVTAFLLNRLADSFDRESRSDYLYSEIDCYD